MNSLSSNERIEDCVRLRVVNALVRNRTKGFHLSGHLLKPAYERIALPDSLVTLEGGPHVECDGAIDHDVLGVLADLSLETAVRAAFGYGVRLVTTALHLQFTGADIVGPLQAVSTYKGLLEHGARRQAIADLRILSGAREICSGSATFVIQDLAAGTVAPLPPRIGPAEAEPSSTDATLDPTEADIMRLTEGALQTMRRDGGSFIRHFWGLQTKRNEAGASGHMPLGIQVHNRAGFVHGGILIAFLGATARAALSPGWIPVSLNVAFIAPGAGDALEARASLIHAGRTTAVVRVQVFGGSSRVMEGLATFSLAG